MLTFRLRSDNIKLCFSPHYKKKIILMWDYVCPKIIVAPPTLCYELMLADCDCCLFVWWDNCLWNFLFLHLFSLAALRFGLFGVFWDPPFPPSTHHQVTIDLVLPREAKRRWTRQSFVGVWLDREVSGRPNVGLALILFIQNSGDIVSFIFCLIGCCNLFF